MGERIIGAAIKGKDGTLYIAASHGIAGEEYVRSTGKRPFPAGDAQGFVTDGMRFVSREEAMTIALDAGQVTRTPTGWDHRTPGEVGMGATELYSEDLRELRQGRTT
jgi:hypothetical protein